jgi:3'-phosphoadenosine 5'-phosphosulfate sulfotransferase (PAPS reductase)/FAD synthetase
MSEANCESGSTKEVQHEITESGNRGNRAGKGIWGETVNQIQSITGRIKNEPVIILFSTGKDSIAASDLFFKYHTGLIQLVYMYFVNGLSFKEKILSHYENRWGCTIDKVPSPVTIELEQNRKVLLGVIEKNLRLKYNIDWIVTGLRCSDSLIRRYYGRLADTDGIDFVHRKLYPIKHWKEKDVFAYCKLNKLPLPVEYSMGEKHDFCHPAPRRLIWLKRSFPDDYRKVIEKFPKLEAIVWREENRGRE